MQKLSEKELRKRYRHCYYEKHAKRHAQRKIKSQKQKVIELLGKQCVICGDTKRRTHYHEIHGLPHIYTYHYILNHIKDFKPLCCRCHNVIHYILNLKEKRAKMYELIKEMGVLKNE